MCPGGDGITVVMLKKGDIVILESIQVLFNKCLSENNIPKIWNRALVLLHFNKGDKLNVDNYTPLSILSHSYKLLTKITTNRLTNKLDEYQPPEQEEFRNYYNRVDHIKTMLLWWKNAFSTIFQFG